MIIAALNEMPLFQLAGINLTYKTVLDGLQVNQNTSSRLFFADKLAVGGTTYAVSFIRLGCDLFPKGKLLFKGEPWGSLSLPFQWSIVQLDTSVGILVNFEGHGGLNCAMVVIDSSTKEIIYYVDSIDDTALIDLYEYPLGVLLTIYLAHYDQGVVVHASGVKDGSNGYLFTGVSGIGKSTMAQLWHQKGAEIVNDDRLVVMPNNKGYVIHNSPMPYYDDYPKSSPLNAIFILKQAKQNRLAQVLGAKAMALLMANCMQHFYSKTMVQDHLTILERIIGNVPVYELEFKPDGDVVDLIRSTF